LKFVSWNVNGIRSIGKKEALRWIDDIDLDFLSLQEIKATLDQIPKDLFNREFKNLYVSSSVNKGQSGVATYTNIDIDYYSNCYEVDILKEGRINELHFNNIAYFNVYFPNGKRSTERLEYKLSFYNRFLVHINGLRDRGYHIIFCGDINTAHKEIDLARAKENEDISGFLPIEREWIDRVIKDGYIDAFRYKYPNKKDRYSWWSMRTRARERNVGWRIDYFFVSNDLKKKIVDCDILDDIKGSDHAPIILDLDIE